MKNRLYNYFISILFLFSTVLSSIKADTTVRKITNINGLSNNSVNCIFQDSERIMWFGTWDGLTSFNSRDFKVYRYSNNDTSISNNVIRQIEETDTYHLWIATDYGLNRWNRKSQLFKKYFTEENLILPKKEKAFMIAQTSDKILIALISDKGLYGFDNKSEQFYPIKNLEKKSDIKKFIIDCNDNIIILYNDRTLSSYALSKDKQSLSKLNKTEFNNKKSIDNIFCIENYTLLYNKNMSILYCIDNNSNDTISITTNKQKQVSAVVLYNGNFIISYLEGGCEIYKSNAQKAENLTNVLSDISIFSLYSGSQNILWIGTDAQGIFQVYNYKSAFTTINTTYPVRAFLDLDMSELLLGTKGGGIKVFNKESRQITSYTTTKENLNSNSVYSLQKNKQGDVFIGSEDSTLSILNKDGQIYSLNTIDQVFPIFKSVYGLAFTNNDSTIWLGTSGFGLIKIDLVKQENKFKAKNVKRYSSTNNSKNYGNDIIYSIVNDINPSKLWIATRRNGLFLFDIITEKFTNVVDINPNLVLSDKDVLTLFRNDKKLWIGTSYGLNSIDIDNLPKSKIKLYNNTNGLYNNTIHGILEKDTNIWISTNQGLSNINEKKNIIINYTEKDGLQNNEFSDGSAYIDNNGIFYFGGVAGFNYFDPNKIDLRNFQPPIQLSNLKIFNTSINPDQRIEKQTLHLAYNEVYTTLSFLSQDYINNQNCEYAYRLSNLSEEWINNGKNPNIVLTNLFSGKYKLQVKVTNGDGVWNDYIYTLTVDVGYPWWLSFPALAAYFIVFCFIVYFSYSIIKNRIRLNKQLLLEHLEKENQKKVHESKLEFFTNVAHEFFTPLTLIYGPAQHLLDRPALDSYTKRYITIIKNNADRMQKLISQLMDFRKAESGHTALYPQNIDLKSFVRYIADSFKGLAEETKIDFDIKVDNISTIISDRNSFEKIIFNLLSNAFKYTPIYGSVEFRLHQQENNLTISVKNTGKGLTQKQQSEIFNKFKVFDNLENKSMSSTGIGLSLVKSTIELLGGTISVESKLDEYVEFIGIIPSLNISEKNQTRDSSDSEIGEILVKEQKNICILIVEDEKEIRNLLKSTLEPYYSVQEAANGNEALEKITRDEPDIIISDILMPELDGIGLIDKLKNDKRTAYIPIISISAKSSLDDTINAYQHGADMYITKPFHPRHLLVTIQNLINKHTNLKEYFNSGLSSISVTDGKNIHHEEKTLLKDIITYIENNIESESLNPSSLAEYLGISKASLYRKLEVLTDKTPSEFIRNIKLNHAANLLLSTKMTVQEIMFKSGFSNKSYFYREFTKCYNTSPLEFRKIKNERKE